MFTGIVEGMGIIKRLTPENNNLDITIQCPFTDELRIDQSVAHNGVCLTVVSIDNDCYRVTAIKETLNLTNLGTLKPGDHVNLERCMKLGDRLDGHIVQGHVDDRAVCVDIADEGGSHSFNFEFEKPPSTPMIHKGSVTINGVSLTLTKVWDKGFSVAIIPYTLEHTTFKYLSKGDMVNIEHDVIGKYVERLMARK